MTKKIVLCADDYARNPAISEGIIKLIQKKRLSATSCMTSSPYWPSHAHWLAPFINQIDIGLHFNLTEGISLAEIPQTTKLGQFSCLPTLLIKSFLRRINPQEIANEFYQQLEQFVAGLGKLPDFIDGHQHVLHLPVIRDVILEIYEKRLRQANVYVRSVYEKNLLRGKAKIKRMIIQLTGGYTFHKKLVENKIPHNTSFSGTYNFSHAKNYAAIFPYFLENIEDGGLIMCHPGLPSTDASDAIYKGRHYEYEYLTNEQFVIDCEQRNIKLSQFN